MQMQSKTLTVEIVTDIDRAVLLVTFLDVVLMLLHTSCKQHMRCISAPYAISPGCPCAFSQRRSNTTGVCWESNVGCSCICSESISMYACWHAFSLSDPQVLREIRQTYLLTVGCSDGNCRQASAYAVSRGQRG